MFQKTTQMSNIRLDTYVTLQPGSLSHGYWPVCLFDHFFWLSLSGPLFQNVPCARAFIPRGQRRRGISSRNTCPTTSSRQRVAAAATEVTAAATEATAAAPLTRRGAKATGGIHSSRLLTLAPFPPKSLNRQEKQILYRLVTARKALIAYSPLKGNRERMKCKSCLSASSARLSLCSRVTVICLFARSLACLSFCIKCSNVAFLTIREAL